MKIKGVGREAFNYVLDMLKTPPFVNRDYVFDTYVLSLETIDELVKQETFRVVQPINPLYLAGYVLGEYIYSVQAKSPEDRETFERNEEIQSKMAAVAADKYLSIDYLGFKEQKIVNKFMPSVSSMNLYLNFMLNMLHTYPKNDPSSTLIVDLLIKSVLITRCIIELLENGHETEAMATWRTLHECECTLIVLSKYNEPLIKRYLKHMRYGLAFRLSKNDREKTEEIFKEIKSEMSEHNLKSKDTKKYIEYGWLYGTNEIPAEELKLNFRDGLETIAGLHSYSSIYEQSSEIVHSTPMLIYSDKSYYYLLTIINTYESFFRIEKIFGQMFCETISTSLREQYEEMRKVYFSQLLTIHSNEVEAFKNLKENLIKKHESFKG